MSKLDGDQYEAYIVPTQGGSPKRILPDDPNPESDPGWSPDGSKIIFGMNTVGNTDKKGEIHILDTASHQVTKLVGSEGKFSPHWSPDGQSIEAASLDINTLYLFDTRTQRWSTIYNGVVGYLSWSSDSRYLYLDRYSGDAAILRIPAQGGKAEVIVDLKEFHQTGTLSIWMGLDPTDAPLMLRDEGTDDVYALSLERK
jgi:Tol biopolymer transport system component